MKSRIETVLHNKWKHNFPIVMKDGTDFSLFLSLIKSYLPTYKNQSFGAKPQMSAWAHFVRKTHNANMLSGIVSHTLQIYIPLTVPVESSTNFFNTQAGYKA
jgi:hypothetical protein